MKIYPILTCILIIVLLNCAKERSCESCYESPTLPPRTIPNELISSCSIFIERENEVRWIYPEQTNKLYPQTWRIFDSIKLDGSHQYNRTYDLKNYLPMDKFKINDTIFVRYEIRWRFLPAEFVQADTLVY
jgi:hypothetical protein